MVGESRVVPDGAVPEGPAPIGYLEDLAKILAGMVEDRRRRAERVAQGLELVGDDGQTLLLRLATDEDNGGQSSPN